MFQHGMTFWKASRQEKKKHDISIGSFHLPDTDHEKPESSYKRWTIREIPMSTFFTYNVFLWKQSSCGISWI